MAGAEALIGEGELPVNTLGFARREVVQAPDRGLHVVEAPPYGAGALVAAGDELVSKHENPLVLENAHLRAELSPEGRVLSLLEKESGRETLAAPGNRLELYDDRPVQFDAWDIDPAHLRTRRDAPPFESWQVVSESPLRRELAFERPGYRQVVRLDAGARRLEFHASVDWRDAGVLAEAHRFNAPLRWVEGAVSTRSLASVDDPNLVLDTIKRAEDSEALVFRLYEAHGARGTARLRLGVPFAEPRLASGLEEDGDALELEDGEIVLPYRPHELLTVKAEVTT